MNSSDHSSELSSETLSREQILFWCQSAAPELWFPSDARLNATAREQLIELVQSLRRSGLIEVGDWVKGRGQGYRLTQAGKMALSDSLSSRTTIPKPSLWHERFRRPVYRTHYDRREITRQALLNPRPAVIAPAVMLLCVGWFIYGALLAQSAGIPLVNYFRESDIALLLKLGAVYGPDVYQGEWWRLGTACFVHIGIVHFLANLFSLGIMGPLAEGLWGRKRFAILFVCSGLASTAFSVAHSPFAVLAGASGAIWGLQTSVLFWVIRFRAYMPAGQFQDWFWRLMFVLMVNAAISFAPGISWQAHFAGGLVGFLAGALLDWTRRGVGRRQFLGGIFGMLLLVLGCAFVCWLTIQSSADWDKIRKPRAVIEKQTAQAKILLEHINALRPTELKRLQTNAALLLLIREGGSQDSRAMEKLKLSLLAMESNREKLVDYYVKSSLEMPMMLKEYLRSVELYLLQLRMLLSQPGEPNPIDLERLTQHLEMAQQQWERLAGANSAREE